MGNKLSVCYFCVGLPASGKTTFCYKELHCNEYFNLDRQTAYFGMDSIISCSYGDSNKVAKLIKGRLQNYPHTMAYFDGLFSSINDIQFILNTVLSVTKINKVVIHYWTPDREACLWNDLGRNRTQNSEATIKGLKIQKPNLSMLREQYQGINFSIVTHEVVRKPKSTVWAINMGLSVTNDKYLESAPWSLGGRGKSYNGSYTIDPEEPNEFEEFDKLLEQICPKITFLQYKYLWKKCITQESRDSGDYYSNCQDGFWRCDLENLYNELKVKNLI